MMSQCMETAGFLFEHQCRNQAVGQCQKCAKPICKKHTHSTPQGFQCTTCAKKTIQKAKRARRDYIYDDDPFLYDAYYYDGYGYYGRGYWGSEWFDDDFTEADGDSFVDHGDAPDNDWDHLGAS